jgi:hypothetical protein
MKFSVGQELERTRLAGAIAHDKAPDKARTDAPAMPPTPDARVTPHMRAYMRKAERAMRTGDK